jgi:NAD(P)-dependent dehydrogenase (short-subunit alcohol dehydrogenase family)
MAAAIDDLGVLGLAGRVVLVTGGARGVGRGITERFGEAGATVVICGRTTPDTPIAAGAGIAEFLSCDVRDADAVDVLIGEVIERHGQLDVVVNNAGGSPAADAAHASPRFHESIIRLNLLAPLHVAQRANTVMQTQDRGGCIVNIGSLSGQRPSPGTAAYGAAKAGLANLTRSLAQEWAPKVRVNLLVGGLIATEQADLHYGDAEAQARVAATVPMGRMATPRDLADACLFLASPLAEHITGAELAVHGGGERPPFLDAASD